MTSEPTSETSDLARLFSEDPLKLTREDHERIVAEYRRNHHLFNQAGQDGRKARAAAKPKKKGLIDEGAIDV